MIPSRRPFWCWQTEVLSQEKTNTTVRGLAEKLHLSSTTVPDSRSSIKGSRTIWVSNKKKSPFRVVVDASPTQQERPVSWLHRGVRLKVVLYNKSRRSAERLDIKQAPQSLPKQKLHPNIMLKWRWNNLLPFPQSVRNITAAKYMKENQGDAPEASTNVAGFGE